MGTFFFFFVSLSARARLTPRTRMVKMQTFFTILHGFAVTISPYARFVTRSHGLNTMRHKMVGNGSEWKVF